MANPKILAHIGVCNLPLRGTVEKIQALAAVKVGAVSALGRREVLVIVEDIEIEKDGLENRKARCNLGPPNHILMV